MDSQTLHPENFPERVLWFALIGTYGFYALGALYLVAPIVGWVLMAYLVWCIARPVPARPRIHIPMPVWIWVLGMLVMLLALLVGHLDNRLGTVSTIKSSIGWAKGWALLAIFPLIGCLPVRPEILYRAACWVGLHTLLLLPVFVAAWLIGAPQTLYVSPLQAVGGPGPEFFALSLYEIDPGSGLPRWRLFTPWAPAVGFVGNIYFVFALQEKQTAWRRIGMLGAVLMVIMSGSRLGLVALIFVSATSWGLARMLRPGMLMLGGASLSWLGLVGIVIQQAIEDFWEAFRAARADSTRVRDALQRIALHRWENEAPIWGHGVVERGPHLVEYMPIGSHHSWLGLLFVKGLVGFLALAIPMLVSALDLLLRAAQCQLERTAFAVLIILFLYTFGENLEILAYLIWPGLVLIGQAHCAPLRRQKRPEKARPCTSQPLQTVNTGA